MSRLNRDWRGAIVQRAMVVSVLLVATTLMATTADAAPPADLDFLEGFEPERICWDPKDCELWVTRTKPEETLVEVRSDTDVQIVHLSCR